MIYVSEPGNRVAVYMNIIIARNMHVGRVCITNFFRYVLQATYSRPNMYNFKISCESAHANKLLYRQGGKIYISISKHMIMNIKFKFVRWQ